MLGGRPKQPATQTHKFVSVSGTWGLVFNGALTHLNLCGITVT